MLQVGIQGYFYTLFILSFNLSTAPARRISISAIDVVYRYIEMATEIRPRTPNVRMADNCTIIPELPITGENNKYLIFIPCPLLEDTRGFHPDGTWATVDTGNDVN